ncbi:MAG: hypothetical protein ABW199_12420 [Caulobacterales bacterium]
MAFYGITTDRPDTKVNRITPRSGALQSGFTAGGRLGFMIGAGTIGLMSGSALAVAIGRLDALIAIVGVTLACVVAAALSGATVSEHAKRNEIASAALAAMHVMALIAWPVALYAAPIYAGYAAYAAIGTLLLMAAGAHLTDGGVTRLSAHSLLLGAALGYQGVLALMG